MIKTTPLTMTHTALGAKMAPFAGYMMPISYTSIQDEHFAVRNQAGLFDVSHMGEFMVSGKNAPALLQFITSNNVSKLIKHQAQYSCFPNSSGGIIDDLIVYRLHDDEEEPKYMLVVNASNIDKDWNWLEENNKAFNATIENISDNCGLLALQGPKAVEILETLTSTDLSSIKFYHFDIGKVAEIEDVIISATGYTGSGGFELYVKNKDLPALWDKVMEAGKDFGLLPAGLGARDTLRLEMGYCLYGNDIDDSTSPITAGLGWITKTKKGPFHSLQYFANDRSKGTGEKLVGFEVEGRRIARHGCEIMDENDIIIGRVTSGGLSPILGKPIGLGYVQSQFANEGEKIFISLGKKKTEAFIKKPPFVEI